MAIDTTAAIVARIVALGIATDTGASTSVFFSRLPTNPDNAIAVRALPGGKADRAFGLSTPAVRENPDVQLVIRRSTIDSMTTVIDQLRAGFDFKEWVESGDTFFTQFAYEPMDFGEDENRREIRTITIDVKRTRT